MPSVLITLINPISQTKLNWPGVIAKNTSQSKRENASHELSVAAHLEAMHQATGSSKKILQELFYHPSPWPLTLSKDSGLFWVKRERSPGSDTPLSAELQSKAWMAPQSQEISRMVKRLDQISDKEEFTHLVLWEELLFRSPEHANFQPNSVKFIKHQQAKIVYYLAQSIPCGDN